MKRLKLLFSIIIISVLSVNQLQANAYTIKGFNDFGTASVINIDSKENDYTGKTVILGGRQFGLDIIIKGIAVLGIEKIKTDNGTISPGKSAGLSVGDVIISANGKEITGISEFAEIIGQANGEEINIGVLSNDKRKDLTIKPEKDTDDNNYHLGLWCTEKTSGIGTVTCYLKEKSMFIGLGHGVTTANKTVLPILSSSLYNCNLTAIIKGTNENPGELHGNFIGASIGKLISNTPTGVYGIIGENEIIGDEIKIGNKNEISTEKADIYCALDNDVPIPYEIEIISIEKNPSSTKNMIIEVTDKRLIDKSGGIVQGMSGSPIVQNGKLIGALTHVIVENQRQGFGIFIENMINNSPI